MSDTLLLNADGRPISYLPISAVHWHISVKLKYLDKVRVVEEYEDRVIRSPSFEMKLPSVLMFYDYHFFPKTPKFSRTNVYLRDLFTCQYCGCRHDTQELTLDHVVPRSKGGHLHWENVVAACRRCNQFKSNRRPEEVGMQLVAAPFTPSHAEFLALINHLGISEDQIDFLKTRFPRNSRLHDI